MEFFFLQKTEIQKAISLASRASAWNSRGAARKRAFDVATRYEDIYGDEPLNQASVKLIVEKLLEHTLNGAPTLQPHPTVSGRLLKISYAYVTVVAEMMPSGRTRSQQLLPRNLQRSLEVWMNRTTKTKRIKTMRMLKTLPCKD